MSNGKKFIFALAALFVVLVLEAAFIPWAAGASLPLTFWFMAVMYVLLERRGVIWFSLSAGFAASFFRPEPAEFLILLFIASALIVLSVRFLGEAQGVVGNEAALITGVFSFQFLQPAIFLLFRAGGVVQYGAFYNGQASFFSYGDFFWNAVFIVFAGLLIFFLENKKLAGRLLYV